MHWSRLGKHKLASPPENPESRESEFLPEIQVTGPALPALAEGALAAAFGDGSVCGGEAASLESSGSSAENGAQATKVLLEVELEVSIH